MNNLQEIWLSSSGCVDVSSKEWRALHGLTLRPGEEKVLEKKQFASLRSLSLDIASSSDQSPRKAQLFFPDTLQTLRYSGPISLLPIYDHLWLSTLALDRIDSEQLDSPSGPCTPLPSPASHICQFLASCSSTLTTLYLPPNTSFLLPLSALVSLLPNLRTIRLSTLADTTHLGSSVSHPSLTTIRLYNVFSQSIPCAKEYKALLPVMRGFERKRLPQLQTMVLDDVEFMESRECKCELSPEAPEHAPTEWDILVEQLVAEGEVKGVSMLDRSEKPFR